MKVPVFLAHQTRLFQKIKDNLIVYDKSSILSAFKSCLRQCSMSDSFCEDANNTLHRQRLAPKFCRHDNLKDSFLSSLKKIFFKC